MFLSVTEFDPVIGIDVHIVLIPTPAGPVPTPLPHPFIGLMLNPLDWIPFFNSIRINYMPAAGVASNAMNAPPGHIPQGGPWMKGTVGNEAMIMLGSSNTTGGGKLMAIGPMIVLSCSCIGTPPIKMSNEMAAAVTYLPTSTVLPIPKGSPVLLGGYPMPDLKALAMAFAMKIGMTWLKGKLRGWQQNSSAWQNLSNRLNQFADNLFGEDNWFRNLVRRGICAVTGHPVDIATGKVFTDIVDFEIPGPLPFRWERVWYSTSVYNGPIGHGWHHNYDLNLQYSKEARCILIRMDDGRLITFPELQPGEMAFCRQERMQLRREDDHYILRSPDQLYYKFKAPTGRSTAIQPLLSVSNNAGFSLLFNYDALGRLTQVQDHAGHRFRVEHNSFGQIAAIFAPHPEMPGAEFPLVRYRYDPQGNLVEALNAANAAFKYRYQRHLLVQETNRNGLSFYFEYDGEDHQAWCTRTWGDDGIYNHKLTYNREERWTIVENSLGQKTKYFWNADGLVFKTIDPLGYERITRYGEFCQIIAEIDELGQLTAYEYDVFGNKTGIVYPDGASVKMQFDDDRMVAAKDENGGKWAWQYNDQQQLVARTDPEKQITRYAYHNGLINTIIAPNGAITKVKFDEKQNLESVLLPDGAVSSWKYDLLGRSTSFQDARGNVTARKYDLLGRVVQIEHADGNVRLMEYDAEGNILQAKDNHQNVRYEYKGMNRLKARTENGTRIEFTYNTEEDLLGIVNEFGFVYRFELDARRDIVTESGFDGLTRRFRRDAAGRVAAVERPNGSAAQFSYDARGRVLEVDYGNRHFERYTYRPDGQLMSASNPHLTVRFERDGLGRVLKETQGAFVVESVYDKSGLRVGLSSSLGAQLRIGRNLMGDVENMGIENESMKGWSAAFERDQTGLEIERKLPGGVRNRWERDKLGRPLLQETSAGNGRAVRKRDYLWDVNYRLLELTDEKGSIRFEHDAFGNLAAASYPDGETELRMPDAVGNLFRTRDRSDRKYGAAGQLLESESARYDYDTEGNLIRKSRRDGSVWHYEWNAAGMLRRVIRPDGDAVSFTYDALGRRIAKQYRNQTTCWVWDGNFPLHEWITEDLPLAPVSPEPKASGMRISGGKGIKIKGREPEAPLQTPVMEAGIAEADGFRPGIPDMADLTTWLFEPEGFAPIAKLQQDTQYSIVSDHLGTPVGMYSAEGEKIWDMDLSVYGEVRSLQGWREACPFRYPGQYEDVETGLYYNRFRYYDPEDGLYVSQDPIRLNGGIDLYSYVTNPLIHKDFFGLVNPFDILFSQDSIGDTFTDGDWAGRSLSEAIEETRALGHLPEGLTLNVTDLNGDYVTLNNRTLYVVQEAGLSQVHPNIRGASATNQLNRLLDGHGPLPYGEQPTIRTSC